MPSVVDVQLLESGFFGEEAKAAAKATKEVLIIYKVPDSIFLQVLIDDVPLVLNSDGEARAMVDPGDHLLHCRARTRPNVEYEIEIKEPAEAAWKPDPPRQAAPSGIINDFHGFTING